MKLLMEQWRHFLQEGKFELQGGAEFFRVTLPGIGYAQGQQHLRFKKMPIRRRCFDGDTRIS